MHSARVILMFLICAVPTILLIEAPALSALVAAFVSAGIIVTANSMRHGEVDFLLTIIPPIAGIAIIPALWMLFQVLPLKSLGLAHPIWQSAEQAFGHSIGSSISIDRGATMIALGQYLCMAAIGILAAAIAVDRERAEWILFALVIATALVALVMIGHDALGLTLIEGNAEASGRAQARVCVALGTIVSSAAMIRTLERSETVKFHPERSPANLKQTFIACAAAFALCATALALNVSSRLLLVAACGLGTLLAVSAIRRIGLGLWERLAIATSVSLAGIVAIAGGLATRGLDVTLAFASNKPEQLVSIAQRISADAPWAGIGAGTFSLMLPVYRDAGTSESAAAPTTAAKIAIELGRPMLWGIVIAVMVGVFVLLRGAFNRGRDSFYAAAGAGSLVLLLLWAFCDTGILGMPVGIFSASIIGLAFAQYRSRSQ